ncbi:MAG: toxin-antitoxin system YwqK family antitoxin [Bacteroidia bacterium]
MKSPGLILFGLLFWAATQAQSDTIPYPTYKEYTLSIRIEDNNVSCDSTDTIRTTIYCWTYEHNRWFARVYKYYDYEFSMLEAKYLAHMAIGPDKHWLPIYLGNFYEYRKNGKPVSIIAFDEGVRKGPSRYYNRQGILRQAGEYDKEIRVGLWRYYNRKGELKYEVEYQRPANRTQPTLSDMPKPNRE